MITGNQLQHFRRMYIEGCLRNNMRYISKEDLLTELNEAYTKEYGSNKTISKRTFENDWKYIKEELKNNGLHLVKKLVENKWCYHYSDTDFSINQMDLSPNDIKKLSDSIQLLQQIKGIDKENDLLLILTKLDTQIKYHSSRQEEIISIQNSEPAKGYHLIDDIYEAIKGQTVLKIVYKPYQKDEFQSVIHPYHLRQFNNRWFLFGWEENRKYVANLALDRMLKISPCYIDYIKPEGVFFPKEYFSNMIGVTRSLADTPQKIKLVFNKERAPYVITKPIHRNQVVTNRKNGKICVELELILNKELIQLILSYGSDVSVKAPKSLVETIKDHARKILNGK